MTDKEQIIINGVDVSGCSGYCPELGKYNCIALACNSAAICKQSPNCYFKQLARKTKECVKLNNKIIDMNSIIEDAAINLGNKDFTLYDLPFEIKKLRARLRAAKLVEKINRAVIDTESERANEYEKD